MEIRLKALIIDYNAEHYSLYSDFLTRVYFEVRSATTEEEALDICQIWQPDLVLFIERPSCKQAFKTICELQSNEKTRSITIIVLSAYGLTDNELFDLAKIGTIALIESPLGGDINDVELFIGRMKFLYNFILAIKEENEAIKILEAKIEIFKKRILSMLE